MSWITFIWSMSAGVSLSLALVHLLVWLNDREAVANLLFSVSAVAAAVIAMQELNLMRAQTPAEFETILRWMHLSVATIIISLVWFVRSYLGAGRLWLAWLITGLRVLILLLNFSLFPNATYQEIHALRDMAFLGEILSVPVGEENPWRILIHIITVLWLIYTLDAAVTVWKSGRARQALVLGASIFSAIILAVIFSTLMVRGILPGPFIALVYQLIVLAMALELSMDMIRSRQLVKELHASQERLHLAAYAANMGLWDWDVQKDKVWFSDFGREWIDTAATKPVRLGQYLALVHPEDRGRIQESLYRALDQRKEFRSEFRITTQDGSYRWIATVGNFESGVQDKSLHLHGISIDITAQKQFEAELQRHRNALARAQRISAMGQFSTTLAHELNQPLGAILRNAEAGEMLLRKRSPDLMELQEILSDIQQDDRRAVDVITGMRALLRGGELRFEAIALHGLIEQVVALLDAEIKARHVELHMTIPCGLPRIRGDCVQLQQVVLNLLLNSLDALENRQKGARKIELEAVRVQDGFVELSISDTGTGIDPEQLPRLFDPFISSKPEGTGFGLAISRTIIEAHGGSIRAKNNTDGGACFRIRLPAAQNEGGP